MANFTPQEIEQFLQEFFDTVGARQYIGARYIPIFGRAGSDTVEWDDLAPYEPLTVVMHNGVSYVSRRYVPTGIEITDNDYWAETYRFNAQIEQYRQEVLQAERDIEANAQAIADMVASLPSSSFEGTTVKDYIDSQDDNLRDELSDDFVPWPNGITWPKYGNLDQVLATLANGTVKWVDPVSITPEVAGPIIQAWMDAHPEASTTIQDGAVSNAKLAANSLAKNKMLEGSFVTWGGILQSGGLGGYTSVDQFTGNTIYAFNANITEEMISDAPVYGLHARVVTLGFVFNDFQGISTGIQIWVTSANDNAQPRFFFRWGTGYKNPTTEKYTYGPWAELPRRGDIGFNDVSDSFKHGFLHSSGLIVFPNATDTYDADTQPFNEIWYISGTVPDTVISNMPIYPTETGILVRLNYSGSNQGGAQLYISNNSFWYRQCNVDQFYNWHKLYPFNITKSDIAEGSAVVWGGILQSGGLGGYTSVDQFTGNTIYAFNANITEAMISDAPIYGRHARVATLGFTRNNSQGVSSGFQIWICGYTGTSKPQMFYRWGTGFKDAVTGKYSYGPWREVQNKDEAAEDSINLMTCSIFRKVVCCGDSYTSGYVKLPGASAADRFNLEFAWPYYMSLLTGQHWINCGHSGTTSLTWQTKQYGLPKAQNSGYAQAYIIGLMINDVAQLPLGVPADIGTDNETYYAQYSKIIRELKQISPDAHIFVQTRPTNLSTFIPYNQAVRDIATAYASQYRVHLLDLYEYRDLYDIPSITGDSLNGHYTPSGYQQFAKILCRVMSEYINAHISDFYDVYTIPYTINEGEI